MNKSLAFASLFSVLVVSSSALADEPAPAAGGAPAAASTDGDDGKKIGVGGDLQFVLPIGDLGDAYGPQIGPLLRVGYRVIPALEVTARVGYLYGLAKSQPSPIGEIKASLNTIPIWLGARYFFMQPGAGAYGAAEFGLNMLSGKVEFGGQSQTGDTQSRFGFNVGAGYVISKDLPIDIRAQFMHMNIAGTKEGEKAALGIGISAGYTASF